MTEWIAYSFLLLSILALATIVFTRNLVYAVWALLVVLLCMVAFYAFLGADFVATTQVMIYIGGILVLIVFGLMLSGKVQANRYAIVVKNKQNLLSALAVLFFVVVCIQEIWKIDFQQVAPLTEPTTTRIAVLLFTKYIFAFEIAGILLLVALLGATLIATKPNS